MVFQFSGVCACVWRVNGATKHTHTTRSGPFFNMAMETENRKIGEPCQKGLAYWILDFDTPLKAARQQIENFRLQNRAGEWQVEWHLKDKFSLLDAVNLVHVCPVVIKLSHRIKHWNLHKMDDFRR